LPHLVYDHRQQQRSVYIIIIRKAELGVWKSRTLFTSITVLQRSWFLRDLG